VVPGVGLEVERPELVVAHDDVGIARGRLGLPSARSKCSGIRFFFASKSGSFDSFQVFSA
jgi:hypothetical protein